MAAGRVLDEDNGHLAAHKNLNHRLDILHCLLLPSLAHEVRSNTRGSGNDEEIFRPLVGMSIGQLGINGSLALHHAIEATMLLFQNHDPILQDTGRLAALGRDFLKGSTCGLNDLNGTIKEMKNVLEARVRREVDAIGVELRGGEAGQEKKIRRAALSVAERLREQGHDLRETLTIPGGLRPIHRGRDQEAAVRVGDAVLDQSGEEVGEHGLDTIGDRWWALSAGQEIGDTSDDTGVGLSPNLLKRRAEDTHVATGQDLGSLQGWIRTQTVLVDVVANVGVANQGEDTDLGHLEDVDHEEQSD